jgi:hypothetical protein
MGGNIGKIVMLVVSIVVLAILFPIILDQAHVITSNANIADYTGLSAFVNLTPLLLWLSAIFGLLGFAGYQGYKAIKTRKSGKSSKRA